MIDAKPPAIISPAPRAEIRFGLSYAISRVAYDRFGLPRDFRDARLEEILPYLPIDLQTMPHWALRSMLLVPIIGWGSGKSLTFLTSTSSSNQTHTLVADWSSSDNKVEVVSAAGNGGNESGDEPFGAGGGGGGSGYAVEANVSLTPGASITFRLRAAGAGTGDSNACWYNGTTLAGSSVGIRSAASGGGGSVGSGGSGGAGALTTNAVGDTKRAGGNGASAAADTPGGGGGAAGPTGVGGNASTTTGGTSDGGTVAAGAAGTQFDATHGSGGGGNANAAGGLYGGGGGGGGSGGSGAGFVGQQGLIILTNNA